MRKAYMAIVQTPLGVWDTTAAVCEGHEAEYRAKHRARFLFARDAAPPFMQKMTDGYVDAFWRAAEHNGCKLIVREVELTQ